MRINGGKTGYTLEETVDEAELNGKLILPGPFHSRLKAEGITLHLLWLSREVFHLLDSSTLEQVLASWAFFVEVGRSLRHEA